MSRCEACNTEVPFGDDLCQECKESIYNANLDVYNDIAEQEQEELRKIIFDNTEENS